MCASILDTSSFNSDRCGRIPSGMVRVDCGRNKNGSPGDQLWIYDCSDKNFNASASLVARLPDRPSNRKGQPASKPASKLRSRHGKPNPPVILRYFRFMTLQYVRTLGYDLLYPDLSPWKRFGVTSGSAPWRRDAPNQQL